MSEQLRLKQRLRQGAAVDLDKRMLGTLRCLMNSLGNEVLPGPGLAGYQNGSVRTRNHGQKVEKLHHLAALADHPVQPGKPMRLFVKVLQKRDILHNNQYAGYTLR